MQIRLSTALALALASGACSSVTEPETAPGMYFEIEYVNFAWEPVWRGLVIDSTRAVQHFDLEGSRWSEADEEYVTGADLAAKWQRNRDPAGRINRSTFEKLTSLLREAQSALSSPQFGCADAGVITYSGYRWDASRLAFQRVIVRREGDIAQLSESAAGRAIADRLVSLGLMPVLQGCEPQP